MTRSRWILPLALGLLGCPPNGPTPPTSSPSPEPTTSSTEVGAVTPTPRTGPLRVAMFYPHEDLFWRDFDAFLQACGAQLDVTVETYMAANDRELMKQQVREAVSGPDPVDAILCQDFKQNGLDLVRIAHEAGVPAFTVNTTPPPEQGRPRAENPHWIGSMVSDDEQGGYDLANGLADEALRLGLAGDDGVVQLIALTGFVSESGSNKRQAGLERAVAERDDLELLQIVPTDWSQEEARLKSAALLERFPQVDAVWTASDPLALGAIESLEAAGRAPGRDAVIGGFDWTREALDAIADGRMFSTYGGHTLEGGWALVLVHDYLRGDDFGPEVEFEGTLRPITRENVERFRAVIAEAPWDEVEFTALSRPDDDSYDFDPVETLDALGD